MSLVVSPTLDQIFKALGDFVVTVVSPSGAPPLAVPCIQLTENRVSMPPPVPGFVGMWLRSQERIMTNLDRWNPQDAAPAAIAIEQAVMLKMQLDCYGAASGDWAVMLSTVLRDEFAVSALAPANLAPLYAAAPRFAPLIAGEEQYERRWIVEAFLQYNPVTSTPMQFADRAAITTIEIDEAYPP